MFSKQALELIAKTLKTGDTLEVVKVLRDEAKKLSDSAKVDKSAIENTLKQIDSLAKENPDLGQQAAQFKEVFQQLAKLLVVTDQWKENMDNLYKQISEGRALMAPQTPQASKRTANILQKFYGRKLFSENTLDNSLAVALQRYGPTGVLGQVVNYLQSQKQTEAAKILRKALNEVFQFTNVETMPVNAKKRIKAKEDKYLAIEYPSRGSTYGRDEYGVYEYSEYPRSSVLSGQTRRVFMDSFPTLEEAQKAYPTAEFSQGSGFQEPSLEHLAPYGDGDDYGDWDEEY